MIDKGRKFRVLATSSIDSLLDGATSSWSSSHLSLPRFRPRNKLIQGILLLLGLLTFLTLILLGWNWARGNDSQYVDLSLIQKQKQNMSIQEQSALLKFASRQLHQPLEAENFREFAQRLRLYRELLEEYVQRHPNHSQLYRQALHNRQKALQEMTELQSRRQKIPESVLVRAYTPLEPYLASPLLWELERELFPWIHHQKYLSVLEMQNKFSGRGIVIPTGSHHFPFAVHLIKQLFHLGCKLPISIAYASEQDLKPDERAYLQKFPGVSLLNIDEMFDISRLELKGWQIKPFALLAAPFSEVILIDADVVFLRNPDFMFTDPVYQAHGVILFHDRTLFSGDKDKVRWLHQHLPAPLSDRARTTRMYRQQSAHELESGVVVWDKQRRLAGLLAVCKLNGKEERERVTYKTFYGDKESFWIGLEMAGQSWGDLESVPGVIGEGRRNKENRLVACGRILHFDRQGQPLWFNGGVVKDKYKNEGRRQLMSFTHYAREGKWEFESSCLDYDVTTLEGSLKDTLQELVFLYEHKVDLRQNPQLFNSSTSKFF